MREIRTGVVSRLRPLSLAWCIEECKALKALSPMQSVALTDSIRPGGGGGAYSEAGALSVMLSNALVYCVMKSNHIFKLFRHRDG